jgi:hypothetical protein
MRERKAVVILSTTPVSARVETLHARTKRTWAFMHKGIF